jgi:taurine dioxygenase
VICNLRSAAIGGCSSAPRFFFLAAVGFAVHSDVAHHKQRIEEGHMEIRDRAGLGVEISGLRIQNASSEEARQLVGLVHAHKLIVLTGQEFDEAEYVTFARKLGTPQVYLQSNYHHPDWPEIFVSSSVKHDGKKFGVRGTGRYWHTDYAFMPEPLSLTMVTPRIIPKSSRGTLYIDMESVYASLPTHLRNFVDAHDAIHEAKWRYKVQESDIDRAIIDLLDEADKIVPPVAHPAVIEHPVRRSRSLYVSSGFTTGFKGVSYEEGKAILAELVEFIEREEHIRQKSWIDGEILFWDNRNLIHKAAHTDINEQNLSYRIGIYDGLQFYTNGSGGVGEVRHVAA